jgi:DNA-binding MarR family transcriptional regulator
VDIRSRPDTRPVEALEALVRVLRSVAISPDLSLSAASALFRLTGSGARLTDLARGEGVFQPAMTQLVGRLERDGLVRRTPSSHDGRGVVVEATEAGRRLVAERRAARAEALECLLDRLAPDDRELITAALPALGRLAEVAGRPHPEETG